MPWRGSFGRILTMQLEPPKILANRSVFLTFCHELVILRGYNIVQLRKQEPISNSAPNFRRLPEKLLKTVLIHQNDHHWPKRRKVAFLDLAHANCTPFFSPKHLDFVTEKNSFFCHLENTVFQTLPKDAFFIRFAHFLLFLGGSNNHSLVQNQRANR